MSNTPFRLALPLAAVLALSGGLTGCAKDAPTAASSSTGTTAGSSQTTASTPSSTGTDSAQPTSGDSSTASPGASDQASGTPAASTTATTPVVATKQATVQTFKLSLALHELRRSGDLVMLDADLTYLSHDKDVLVTPSGFLVDDEDNMSGIRGLPNGFVLLDMGAKKGYRPASRTDKITDALCTPPLSGSAKDGDTVTVSCTFAGVPTNVTSLTVQIPTFGSVPNVAIR